MHVTGIHCHKYWHQSCQVSIAKRQQMQCCCSPVFVETASCCCCTSGTVGAAHSISLVLCLSCMLHAATSPAPLMRDCAAPAPHTHMLPVQHVEPASRVSQLLFKPQLPVTLALLQSTHTPCTRGRHMHVLHTTTAGPVQHTRARVKCAWCRRLAAGAAPKDKCSALQ
jgi:hypothetical protein